MRSSSTSLRHRKRVSCRRRAVAVEFLERRTLLSSISGTVFQDANLNGVQDAGEPALVQQHVWLDTNNDGTWEPGEPALATDGSGNFAFSGLAAGTYHVRLYSPPGFHETNAVGDVVLQNQANVGGISFGLGVGAASGSIRGYVWGDANQDGAIDTGEFALPGHHVWLDTNNDGAWEPGEPAVTTDAGGSYQFSALQAGTYHVRYYVYPGYHQTNVVNPVTVGSGTVTINFGVASGNPAISISGNVFNDSNENGLQDPSEAAIADQHVWLDTNNDGTWEPGEPAAVTDSSGSYLFTNLAPGTYHVRYYEPATFHQTTPEALGARTLSLTVATPANNIDFGVAAEQSGPLKIAFNYSFDASGFFSAPPAGETAPQRRRGGL